LTLAPARLTPETQPNAKGQEAGHEPKRRRKEGPPVLLPLILPERGGKEAGVVPCGGAFCPTSSDSSPTWFATSPPSVVFHHRASYHQTGTQLTTYLLRRHVIIGWLITNRYASVLGAPSRSRQALQTRIHPCYPQTSDSKPSTAGF
jgi:hypothetical protein